MHYKMEIKLEIEPPLKAQYHFNQRKLEEFKSQMDEFPCKLIHKAKQIVLQCSPILFVDKKNSKLKICVDKRALNRETVKNYSYPLSWIDDPFDWLVKLICVMLSSRIVQENKEKMTCRTYHGSFKLNLVMPFGLSNISTMLMTLVNMST